MAFQPVCPRPTFRSPQKPAGPRGNCSGYAPRQCHGVRTYVGGVALATDSFLQSSNQP